MIYDDGPAIDAHDAIIRFNSAPTKPREVRTIIPEFTRCSLTEFAVRIRRTRFVAEGNRDEGGLAGTPPNQCDARSRGASALVTAAPSLASEPLDVSMRSLHDAGVAAQRRCCSRVP
eukprot:1184493-Prorocentrum_minimum.AAC.2